MNKIIGVRFKRPGKVYFFDAGNIDVNVKDKVIVETAMGQEIGEVIINNKNLANNKIKTSLKPIVRVATGKDLKHLQENKEKEKEAFKICEEKIKSHNLNMSLVDVAYTFDNAKLLFYFTADSRIDFRELVKDLASIFKTRIELRQIGVRDQVRRIGGNGVCGRELCCCTFLNNFDTFLLVFPDICLNISGIGSYVNFIFDLNMFNAFLISSSSSTLNLYFCDIYLPIKADDIKTKKSIQYFINCIFFSLHFIF